MFNPFSFDEFDIFYFEINEKVFNISNNIKLFKFRIKSYFLFKFFLFTPLSSLFFTDSFILIISHIEILIINFLLNLYSFFINLNSINYNR